MRDKIEEVLNEIRPALQADGGDVEFIGSGLVVAQAPKAESPMGDDRRCRLTLR